jgi:hypothetical protein
MGLLDEFFHTLHDSMDAVGCAFCYRFDLHTMQVLQGTELSFCSFLLLVFVSCVAVMLLFRFIGLRYRNR